jgi:SAM-dependent methyltransferase
MADGAETSHRDAPGGAPDPWTDDPATWPPTDHERERAHWLIERELRERLLASRRAERERVTAEVYDELFRRVPWHPGNTGVGVDEEANARWIAARAGLVPRGGTVVDLGCGRGAVVRGFARRAGRAIGIDASEEMILRCSADARARATFMVGGMVEPDLPPESVDLITSNQAIEHLHPDDIDRHLRAVRRILRPGGRLLITTPQALTGPWDCSRGFTETPTGFHTAEMDHRDLRRHLLAAGFRRVRSPVGGTGARSRVPKIAHLLWVPTALKVAAEGLLRRAPRARRGPLARALNLSFVETLATR